MPIRFFRRHSHGTLLFFAVILAVVLASLTFILIFCNQSAPAKSANSARMGSAAAGAVQGGAAYSADPGSGQDVQAAALPAVAVSEWAFPIISSVTGPNSDTGVAAAWGFNHGLQRLNETGGIRGVPAKSVVHDTSDNAEKTVVEMQGVASGALAAIGPVGTATPAEAYAVAAGAKLPLIASVADGTRAQYAPFVVSCTETLGVDAQLAAREWIQRSTIVHAIGIVYDPTDEASAARYAAVKALLDVEGDAVTFAGAVEISGDRFDAPTEAQKAIATGADGFYIELSATNTARMAAQLVEQRVRAASILVGPSVLDETQAAGKDAAGAAAAKGKDAKDAAPSENAVPLSDGAGGKKDASQGGGSSSALAPPALPDGIFAWYAPGVGGSAWAIFEEAAKSKISADKLDVAADYYEAALLVGKGIEELGLTGDPAKLESERERLSAWLYNVEAQSSLRGAYVIKNGAKSFTPKLMSYKGGGFSAVE